MACEEYRSRQRPDEESIHGTGNMRHTPADQTGNSAVSCDWKGEQAAHFRRASCAFLCLRTFSGGHPTDEPVRCLPLKIFAASRGRWTYAGISLSPTSPKVSSAVPRSPHLALVYSNVHRRVYCGGHARLRNF